MARHIRWYGEIKCDLDNWTKYDMGAGTFTGGNFRDDAYIRGIAYQKVTSVKQSNY